ncbi:MAG: hypothetical protein V4678_00245 [Patescibacteria group bacterium]
MPNKEPFERLEATYANGFAAQTILLDDYLRVGVPTDSARRMVNGLQGDTLEVLVNNMEAGEREYYGIREDGILAGFASLGEWYPGDEEAFMSQLEYLTARMNFKADRIMNGETPTKYDGIHALAVAGFVDNYESVAVPMIDGLRQRSGQRGKNALRITADAEDEALLDVLEREGEPIKRKLGMVTLHGVTRGYFLYQLETR